ncbi:MAG: hypothetical protein M0Z61_01420 [Nitrospiraceae bacterium]|nr:hypothetical protein [Nitrospiraceae bacterium]
MKAAVKYVLVLAAITIFAQAALAAPKSKTLSMEKQIGAPIYPGAVYLEHLASMQMIPGHKAYFFKSDAEPRTVANFYMKKLHKKPGMFKGENALVFPLSGTPPKVDEYVSVAPNTFGGTSKTIITIVKRAGKVKSKTGKLKSKK